LVQSLLLEVAGYAALAIEAIAVVLVAFGAFEALARSLSHIFVRTPAGWRKDIWVEFGMWLLLGLQFALAADIIRSTIAPTWGDIGKLGAIAVIRTFLNFFLERDIAELRRTSGAARDREMTVKERSYRHDASN
jgi:uncharacterized membrane protein